MIRVEGLSRTFRHIEALKNVSFSVAPGEILGLIGHNGSGKTTAIRCMAGILEPTSGSVWLNNADIRKNPIEAKQVLAYLPDNPAFFENLTAWEHVAFIAKIFRVKGFEKQAEELFDRFELSAKKEALGSELSRGMRQRLSLICALIHQPKVLLLDEPMLGLDPAGIRLTNHTLAELARRGSAIVISSHLLALLEEICTKVVVLIGGNVRLYGTVTEVRSEISSQMERFSLEELFFYANKGKG